jgi:3-oxoacyl-[acyl-carrier-protein] synthase II
MLGHAMGAASALEAVASALAVKNDILPPTTNFETPDTECDIDCVPNQARRHRVNVALNNSYAFGGNNASLVLKKYVGTN